MQQLSVLLLSVGIASASREFDITWYAPFQAGGGYCSEAHAFAAVMRHLNFSAEQFAGVHHGDSFNADFVSAMSSNDFWFLKPQRQFRDSSKLHVVICHSEPGAWHAPFPKYYTQDCPPRSSSPVYKIGRTMFETDSVPDGWISRLNFMDEIWVPSEFQRKIFAANGVDIAKLHVVGEPVDTDFFHPTKDTLTTEGGIKFLFVGKWEERKGLKILLRAFLKEFCHDTKHSVKLTILTSAYHSTNQFWSEIELFVDREKLIENISDLTNFVEVISDIPQRQMPGVYSSAVALVIPSRGEGWGRPHVEAMSCGVPVVATNWSGPTVYLDETVGYPLRINGLINASGWKGHQWADPSEVHLRQILREIYNDPKTARAKGNAARIKMVSDYSLKSFSVSFVREINRISLQAGASTERETLVNHVDKEL